MSLIERLTGKSTEATERRELERLAQIVNRHVETWPEVGAALREIRDRKLYRLECETWPDFLRTRWNMSEGHASRLIAAAGVAENLLPRGKVLPTEAHARPLTRLPAEHQAIALDLAERLAGGDQPTAGEVDSAVELIAPRNCKTTRRGKRRVIRIRVPGAIVVIEPGRAFTTAEDAIRDALGKIRTRDAA